MSPPSVIVQRVSRALSCSACGAAGEANCDCGAPYMPASVRAAKAITATPNKSDRAIAAEIGVADRTVNRARATATHDAVESRVGLDGKARKQPAKRKRLPPPIKVAYKVEPTPANAAIKVKVETRDNDGVMPTEAENQRYRTVAGEECYQQNLFDQVCVLLEQMTDETRKKFFAHLRGKYLNALGLPRSQSFDPKWKRRTPLTSINRLRVKPPKIRDAPPRDIGDEHVNDFRALDDADEHVIDYYSVMEEAAFSSAPSPDVSVETMKAKLAALDDGLDIPESLRREPKAAAS
jgi:hypothetical protein